MRVDLDGANVPRTLRIPLWFGLLKLKHREKLSFEERTGHFWMKPLGKYRLIWCSESSDAPPVARGEHPVKTPRPPKFAARGRD